MLLAIAGRRRVGKSRNQLLPLISARLCSASAAIIINCCDNKIKHITC